MNPKVFEAFTDPSGGEWIRFKSGIYKDVCWRPSDLSMAHGDRIAFKVEFFEGPGFVIPEPTDTHFEEVCTSVLKDMLLEAAAQEVAEDAAKPRIIT